MNRPGTLTFVCYFSVMYGFYCLLSLFFPYGNGISIIDLTHYLLANIEYPKTLLIFFNMLILPLLYIVVGLGLVNGNNWARWVFIIGSIVHFMDIFTLMGLNIYKFDFQELFYFIREFFISFSSTLYISVPFILSLWSIYQLLFGSASLYFKQSD